jgi:hypothetical protein
MKNRILLVVIIFGTFFAATAQNVAINGTGTAPDNSAILDLSSTSKGFLPPRMTVAQRDAILNPATGLVVFNTTTNCLNVYQSGAWSDCLAVVNAQVPITRVYTSSATWTKPVGLKYVVVRLVGGGGSGANAVNSVFGGSGGGGGGYSEKFISNTGLSSTVVVTVGQLNGVSSFGSYCQATGGSNGGQGNGGLGGIGSGGDINSQGEDGESNGEDHAGSGGSSVYGGGGRGGSRAQYGSINGNPGHNYGGGGGAGCDGGLGASGAPGVVIVTEYY